MAEENYRSEFNSPDFQLSVETEIVTVDFQKTDTLVGMVLDGRFLIEKDLTETGGDAGGIGLVYLAKDMKLLGRNVVIKILHHSLLDNEDIFRKFQHEKEALIRLNHPNIVRILDSGNLLDGNPFLVMEYIIGCSLERNLRENGRLSFDVISHIAESVTDALGAAHSQKILHRDIKPANIMLTPQEQKYDYVRLIDFGIARVENSRLAEATQTSLSMGTLPYMAPEQLQGSLEQTAALDIYAFAIVIYRMLTGVLPFKPHNQIDMFTKQMQGVSVLPSELRPDIPKQAEKLIMSALEFEPNKRPQNARVFGQELAKVLHENNKSNNRQKNIISPKTIPFSSRSENITIAPTQPSPKEDKSNFQLNNSSNQRPYKSKNKLLWVILGGLLLVALTIPLSFVFWNNSKTEIIPETTTKNDVNTQLPKNEDQRILRYFLSVQKMRDGKPYEQPFKSSGQEIFEDGYKFKLNFESESEGYIYIFNENKDSQGNPIYNILFPVPTINKGNAKVSANQLLGTDFNTFGGNRGTEIVWFVWSANKQDDLESARRIAFDNSGKIAHGSLSSKLTNLFHNNAEQNLQAIKDTPKQLTILKGVGSSIVHKLELEHR